MESEGRCHAEASIELGLDPQAAWDVVMDWERQSRWMLLTRVWATEQGGAGVGGGVAARTSVGAIGFTDDMVITHWDPPRECTVKHLGKLVRGTGTFTITAILHHPGIHHLAGGEHEAGFDHSGFHDHAGVHHDPGDVFPGRPRAPRRSLLPRAGFEYRAGVASATPASSTAPGSPAPRRAPRA